MRPAASDDAQRALYYDPRDDPRPEQDRFLPILAFAGRPERSGGGAAFVVLTILALIADSGRGCHQARRRFRCAKQYHGITAEQIPDQSHLD